jgi:beta-mannosidase
MNFLRSWGGGYYESDDFFDLADELGLLVWQDFMFGGGMQPAYDDAFRANVVAEARDNVRRLRNHPSIALWCGNNEEEIAWKYWGPGKEMTAAPPGFARKVWDGYVQLFGADLRKVVAEEGGGIAYWASSPGDDLAEVANTPASGDMHYWEVWGNPAHPPSTYLEITPRFMSEYGLQAWPVQRTDRRLRQARRAGHRHAGDRGAPEIPGREGQRAADEVRGLRIRRTGRFRHLRLPEPGRAGRGHRTGRAAPPRQPSVHDGLLYWQLNDVWPGASWSSVDWLGRWKALQFHARRFYAPVAVAALRIRNGKTMVSLLNDRTRFVRGELRLRVMALDGKLLRDERKPVELAPLSAAKVADYLDAALLGNADPASTVAVFDLARRGRAGVARRGVFQGREGHGMAGRRPARGPAPRWHGDGDGYTLDLRAAALARAVWVDFGAVDADVSDNALTCCRARACPCTSRPKPAWQRCAKRCAYARWPVCSCLLKHAKKCAETGLAG